MGSPAGDQEDADKHGHARIGWSSSVRRRYDEQLRVRPRITNFCVSFLISSLADLVAQTSEHRIAGQLWMGYDLRRTRALALTCGTYNGVILTTWLLTLGFFLPHTDIKSVLCKLCLTQFLLQPFVYVPFFFLFHGSAMGDPYRDSIGHLQHDYFALLVRLWSIFMPTRLMMFVFVPLRYQVLWDSSVSFFWQLILSLFAAKHIVTSHAAHPEIIGAASGSILLQSSELVPFSGASQGDTLIQFRHKEINLSGR